MPRLEAKCESRLSQHWSRAMSKCSRYAAASVVLLTWSAGCRQLNNVWVDSGIWANSELTPPPAEGFRERDKPPPQTQRDYPRSRIHGFNGAVTHWPVWWGDPFVDKGNGRTDPADRDRAD